MNLIVSKKLNHKGVSYKLADELTDFVSQGHDFGEETEIETLKEQFTPPKNENSIISSRLY